MFCKNCGAQINEQSKFCGSCGAIIEREEERNNRIPYSFTDGDSEKSRISTKNKNKIIGIGACAVFLILIIVITVSIINKIGSGGYEEIAEKYATALVQGNYYEINKYLPYDLKKLMGARFDAECKDFDEYYDENRMIINAKAIDFKEIDSKMEIAYTLNDFSTQCQRNWGQYENIIDFDNIKKVYEVTVRIEVYEKDEDEYWPPESFTYTIIRYKGKWKVLTAVEEDLHEIRMAW